MAGCAGLRLPLMPNVIRRRDAGNALTIAVAVQDFRPRLHRCLVTRCLAVRSSAPLMPPTPDLLQSERLGFRKYVASDSALLAPVFADPYAAPPLGSTQDSYFCLSCMYIYAVAFSCLSEIDLEEMPFNLSSAKAGIAQYRGNCLFSEEEQRPGFNSWRMVCTESDSNRSDTRTEVMLSETEVRSSSITRDNSPYDTLGPDGMKVEFFMKRVGDCDKIADKK